MGSCFVGDPTIFFVGGQGTKAGHATPGGATLDWFEEKGTSSAGFDLSDIMDANGGPINSTTTGHSWTAATKTMTPGAANQFDGAEVGMVAHLADPTFGSITVGRYTITAVVMSGDNVLSLTFGNMVSPADYSGVNTPNATVCIGGAFASMNAAIGSSSPLLATSYDVHVHDNLDEAAMTEIVLGVTGTLSANSSLRYWGFNETPGDRMPGGAYERTWTSKAAGANTLIDPEARDNIMFYCMYLQNNDVNDSIIEPGTSTDQMDGWLFQHCKLENTGGDYCIGGGVWIPALFYDCELHSIGPSTVNPQAIGTALTGLMVFVDTDFYLETGSATATFQNYHAMVFVNCSAYSTPPNYCYGIVNGAHIGTILINCVNATVDNPATQDGALARVNNAKGWLALIRSSAVLADAGDDQVLAWIRRDAGGTLATVSDCNSYSDLADAASAYICQDSLNGVAPSAATEIHNWWWLPETYCRQVKNDLDSDYRTQNRILKRGSADNLAIGIPLPLNFSNPLFGGTVVR